MWHCLELALSDRDEQPRSDKPNLHVIFIWRPHTSDLVYTCLNMHETLRNAPFQQQRRSHKADWIKLIYELLRFLENITIPGSIVSRVNLNSSFLLIYFLILQSFTKVILLTKFGNRFSEVCSCARPLVVINMHYSRSRPSFFVFSSWIPVLSCNGFANSWPENS